MKYHTLDKRNYVLKINNKFTNITTSFEKALFNGDIEILKKFKNTPDFFMLLLKKN